MLRSLTKEGRENGFEWNLAKVYKDAFHMFHCAPAQRYFHKKDCDTSQAGQGCAFLCKNERLVAFSLKLKFEGRPVFRRL